MLLAYKGKIVGFMRGAEPNRFLHATSVPETHEFAVAGESWMQQIPVVMDDRIRLGGLKRFRCQMDRDMMRSAPDAVRDMNLQFFRSIGVDDLDFIFNNAKKDVVEEVIEMDNAIRWTINTVEIETAEDFEQLFDMDDFIPA